MRIPIENPTIKQGKIMEITQYWGENPELYQANFGIPGHNGLDFVYLNPTFLPPGQSSYGKPVLSAIDGKVTCIIWDGEHATKGNGIYIENDEFQTIYWHLSKICVETGKQVKMGEKIGEMGNSGYCFPKPTQQQPYAGTHLHFGVRPKKTNYNNGYEGYVDPLPLLELKTMQFTVDKTKLSQIYNEMLFREPDEAAISYLGLEESAVRKSIGESEERKKLINLINLARQI